MMVGEFSAFGSGASIHIFNKSINEDFNRHFHITSSLENVGMISLMSEAIDFDEDLINSSRGYDNICVKRDLTKDFLDFLKTAEDLEYLIIDTFNDVEYGVIEVDGSYVTGTQRLKRVDFFNSLKSNLQMNIHTDFDAYFELWKDSCDRFFEFLSSNRPDIKVILNMARLCYRYREDGKVIEKESFRNKSGDNKLRDILDGYILENYDVEVLKFSEDTLIDKDYIFGLQPIHYEAAYFDEKNRQLTQIIQKNQLYDYDSPVNRKIRQIDRNDVLFEIKYKEIKKII